MNNRSSRTLLVCALLACAAFSLGCSNFFYNLQPYRLQRLNRGPAPSLDPEFTLRSQRATNRLAQQNSAANPAKLSVNSAEEAAVRAQSPD